MSRPETIKNIQRKLSTVKRIERGGVGMTGLRSPPADAMQTARFALEQLRENLPLFIELMEIQAKMAKAKFDAFVSAGFAPQQALELTKEDAWK